MRRGDYQKMMEWLAVVLCCPVCSNKYSAEQTSLIEAETATSDHSSMLVHADCGRCKSSVVFNIAMDGPEIFSVGMVTDLTASDVKKFREVDMITPNEVIEFHEYLTKFDGDFEQILQ